MPAQQPDADPDDYPTKVKASSRSLETADAGGKKFTDEELKKIIEGIKKLEEFAPPVQDPAWRAKIEPYVPAVGTNIEGRIVSKLTYSVPGNNAVAGGFVRIDFQAGSSVVVYPYKTPADAAKMVEKNFIMSVTTLKNGEATMATINFQGQRLACVTQDQGGGIVYAVVGISIPGRPWLFSLIFKYTGKPGSVPTADLEAAVRRMNRVGAWMSARALTNPPR